MIRTSYIPTYHLRIAYDDDKTYLHQLDAVDKLRHYLDIREQNIVAAMRRDGTTWEVIGAMFNTTRQAAQQRFGR
jgi:hypothetical protein